MLASCLPIYQEKEEEEKEGDLSRTESWTNVGLKESHPEHMEIPLEERRVT